MKHLMMTCALAALLALPFAASAQKAAPKADAPAASSTMMNCPMMGNMAGMQKDMGSVMSEMQAMMKDTKDPALKDRIQKMHDRMSAMMVNMQNMSSMGMMGNMMGGQQPGNAAPAKQQATPPSPPESPEDHAAHHPAP